MALHHGFCTAALFAPISHSFWEQCAVDQCLGMCGSLSGCSCVHVGGDDVTGIVPIASAENS